MELGTYIILFSIIVIIGQIFKRSTIPITLLLFITGMILSFIPFLPQVQLDPNLVLNVFLPLLVYQIGAFSSWKDVKKNIRPITLLSVGHVIFITFLVAFIIHALIPQFGWPLAFVLGAVISPPDDVAIVSIAEKIHMPTRIITILEGEGMFNDATALILFRFALAALLTHEFSVTHAVSAFFLDVFGEIIYGLIFGFIIGELRTKIQNPMIHIIASILTPFLAYLPPEYLGGSGILSTVITGFIIGNFSSLRFTPEYRLIGRAMWPGLAFAIQSFLFLLVGLDFRFILDRISTIANSTLLFYTIIITVAVVIGRFIWVFPAAYLPRFFFPSIRKKDPYPPWQFIFVISWAGMRGAISLAAALAVPTLSMTATGLNPKDLLVFLVFCVIITTFLLQGLTLPWILKVLGIKKYGQREKYDEHLMELKARNQMVGSVLKWLKQYKTEVSDDKKLSDEIKLQILEYKMIKKRLRERIANHDGKLLGHDEQAEIISEVSLIAQIIEVERTKLLELWRNDKINLTIRNKLLDRLDHRSKHLPM